MINTHGRFVWYGLMATDMAGAKAFYSKLLDWSTQDASGPDTDFALFSTANDPPGGQTAIAGLMRLSDEAKRMGALPMWIGYVGVDDVDASARQVQKLGGLVHVPPTDVPDISRFAIVADPQMATLALFNWHNPEQHEAPEFGKTWRVGWHELLAADWEKAFAFYNAVFGWQKADADFDGMATYQEFSIAGETIGGMFTKPPMVPAPFWLYYFNVGDIDAAAEAVKAGGGEIVEGPVPLRSGRWTLRCVDPQGTMFALQGPRIRKTVGYFEGSSARDPSSERGRRWSW
jgi:uncharacterized protein